MNSVYLFKSSQDGHPLELVMQWIDELWSQETEAEKEPVKSIPRMISSPTCERFDFRLQEPLKSRQRKSYDGESRFLSPKPVVLLDEVNIFASSHHLRELTIHRRRVYRFN